MSGDLTLIETTLHDKLRSTTMHNALWQIDASPVDALCVDGHHAIYCCIDIATRRAIWDVSRTPCASAVGPLIRKAILAWGIPDTIEGAHQ